MQASQTLANMQALQILFNIKLISPISKNLAC